MSRLSLSRPEPGLRLRLTDTMRPNPHHPPTRGANLLCPTAAHGNLEDKTVQASLSRLKTLKASVSLIFLLNGEMPAVVPPQEHLGGNMFDSLRPHGLQSARLLCPWDSPVKTPGYPIGVGSHFLLQGIFSIQASNLHLLHYWWILHLLSHRGSPMDIQSMEFSRPEHWIG